MSGGKRHTLFSVARTSCKRLTSKETPNDTGIHIKGGKAQRKPPSIVEGPYGRNGGPGLAGGGRGVVGDVLTRVLRTTWKSMVNSSLATLPNCRMMRSKSSVETSWKFFTLAMVTRP